MSTITDLPRRAALSSAVRGSFALAAGSASTIGVLLVVSTFVERWS